VGCVLRLSARRNRPSPPVSASSRPKPEEQTIFGISNVSV
jgi:hypothetical protein